jgi:predicted site-specific integrase-resolvase
MVTEFKTAKELGAVVRLDPGTIHRLAREGRIPCVRVTRKTVRFILADVLEAIGVGRESHAEPIIKEPVL